MAKFERWTQSGMNPQVATLPLNSQPWGADFINHSLSNFSPLPDFCITLSNPSSGDQSLDHTLELQQPKQGGKRASSAPVVRDKTELPARIHVVRIFLKTFPVQNLDNKKHNKYHLIPVFFFSF